MSDPNAPPPFPAPPGPAPHGPYEYLIIPPQPPVPPDAPFYLAFTAFQMVEMQMALHGISADRIDMFNGNRVYRILLQYIWRFDSDAQGPFVGRPPQKQFRLTLDDPTGNRPQMNDWMPFL